MAVATRYIGRTPDFVSDHRAGADNCWLSHGSQPDPYRLEAHWDESLPAFLIVVGMPLTYSIADGMALGFIAYPLIKLFCGKAREVNWSLYLIAVLFILRYAF